MAYLLKYKNVTLLQFGTALTFLGRQNRLETNYANRFLLKIILLTNNKADPCHFLLSGIMTLPSSPCEIENMSLFQDLKLKRRKVDSRCSSDGKNASEICHKILRV